MRNILVKRVLHIKKLIGSKKFGQDGLISIENLLRVFDLEEIFGSKYSSDNLRYVRKTEPTDNVTLVLGKLEY